MGDCSPIGMIKEESGNSSLNANSFSLVDSIWLCNETDFIVFSVSQNFFFDCARLVWHPSHSSVRALSTLSARTELLEGYQTSVRYLM